MDTFQLERQQFYTKINGFWHDLFGEEYALWDVKKDSHETIDRIRVATDIIGQVLFKTAPLLRQLDHDTLGQLGFPEETINFIRYPAHPL